MPAQPQPQPYARRLLPDPQLAVTEAQPPAALQPPQQRAQPPLASPALDDWTQQTLNPSGLGRVPGDPRSLLATAPFRPDPNAPPLPPGEPRRPLGKDLPSDFVEFLKGIAFENEADSSIAQHLGATLGAGVPVVGALRGGLRIGKTLPQAKALIQSATPEALERLAAQFPAFAMDLKQYRTGEALPPALGHLADVLLQTEKPGVYALKPEVQARIAHFLESGKKVTRQANWQGSTSDEILKAFDNDKELADIWARMTGATSAGTDVPRNVEETVHGMRQYLLDKGKPFTKASLEELHFGLPEAKFGNMNQAVLQEMLSGDKVEAFAQLMRDFDRIPLDRHAIYALGGITDLEGEAKLARHIKPLREYFGNLEGRPPKYKSNGAMYGTLNESEAYERVERAFADTLRALDPEKPLKDIFAQMWEGVRDQRGAKFQGGPIDLLGPRGLLERGAMTDPAQMFRALQATPGKNWTPAALIAALAALAQRDTPPESGAAPASGRTGRSAPAGPLVPPGTTGR